MKTQIVNSWELHKFGTWNAKFYCGSTQQVRMGVLKMSEADVDAKIKELYDLSISDELFRQIGTIFNLPELLHCPALSTLLKKDLMAKKRLVVYILGYYDYLKDKNEFNEAYAESLKEKIKKLEQKVADYKKLATIISIQDLDGENK